jgi:hypothetical protein
MGHRLHIEEDGVGGGVLGEVVEHVAEIDVAHVADRGEMGKPDAAALGPVDDAEQDRARLADEGDAARLGVAFGEGRIETDGGRHDAHAIRSDDAQQMGPGGLEHGLAQDLALGEAAVPEAGRDDDDAPRAPAREFADDTRYRFGWGADDGQIRGFRQACHVRMTWPPVDHVPFRVHQHDRSGIAAAGQVAGDDRADRAPPLAGADQGNRARAEKGIEIADGHCAVDLRNLDLVPKV